MYEMGEILFAPFMSPLNNEVLYLEAFWKESFSKWYEHGDMNRGAMTQGIHSAYLSFIPYVAGVILQQIWDHGQQPATFLYVLPAWVKHFH